MKIFPEGMSIRDIRRLSEYRIELLAVLVFITFTIFFYAFVYSNNRSEMMKADIQIKALELEKREALSEREQKKGISERLKSSMEGLRQVENEFKAALEKLPAERQLSQILAGITDEEARKNIKFISVKPLPAEEKKEFVRLPFQISMNTRFTSFGRYLENLERSSRLFTIEDFKIETKEDIQPNLNIQLYLSTYVLQGGE